MLLTLTATTPLLLLLLPQTGAGGGGEGGGREEEGDGLPAGAYLALFVLREKERECLSLSCVFCASPSLSFSSSRLQTPLSSPSCLSHSYTYLQQKHTTHTLSCRYLTITSHDTIGQARGPE